MSWNHRVIHDTSDVDDERWYIAEYHYGKDGNNGCTDALTVQVFREHDSEDEQQSPLKSLRWTLEMMLTALDKPIIHWDGKVQREG